ncbi:protein kinase family protein, putative [Ichthyophthirius multifiliis]|uniref:Protein kinase family protein, putative n=1 Tax=Ichthyophthirius multifiliis TaxID=5932 RepID=G0QRB4_ICHMU|nr:protein kinase family protein, putative [Ichthyophthirius multifiliis]EGR32266.1 protein kinase family protein, putative [Ichthyophthirius multifiliis]|eukprot:XP_004035752.1 protein kinase family protein, putative [Ichthyophthirius multifiliis]
MLQQSGINKNFIISFKELEFGKKIGEGSYGEVYQGNWLGQDVAIKIINIIEDIALGMRYLHGIKVLHCDLKSSNVLIDENRNVKLCDFGLSRIKSKLNQKKNKIQEAGLIGTPQWMAPEVMRREQYQEHSDVYSFGMILWEMLTRNIPYKGMSHQQIYGTVGYDELYEVPIPKIGIPRYLKLMKKCLNRLPESRPSFKDIVEEIQETKQQEFKDSDKKLVVKELIRFFY